MAMGAVGGGRCQGKSARFCRRGEQFRPDDFAVRGVAGAPARGELCHQEEAAASFIAGFRPSHVGCGAAAVRDRADETVLRPDEPQGNGATRMPDRVVTSSLTINSAAKVSSSSRQ